MVEIVEEDKDIFDENDNKIGYWRKLEDGKDGKNLYEDYEEFRKTFLYIFDMKKELYVSKIKKYSKYVIGYDENCPTHIYLNKFIKEDYEQ